jgi:predicted transcriptional regulator
MAGEKKVEFRKVRFREEVTHIVVYASGSVRRVLGYFRVAHIDHAPPSRLWAMHGRTGGLAEDEFWAYYRSARYGVAIGVGEVRTLNEPLPLSTLGENLTVPQSFAYLADEAFEKLQELMAADKAPGSRKTDEEKTARTCRSAH